MESATSKRAVAERLKTARARLFGTAADAARAMGMKPVTVRAHESGQNTVSMFDLERYARRYGVAWTWLATGEGGPSPSHETFYEYGEPLAIHTLVEDGAWLPADDDEDHFPVRQPFLPDGEPEFAIYSDPRYPAELIVPLKVVSHQKDGIYIDGTVAFAIPAVTIGYGDGAHVVLIRERNGFFEWSLRRLEKTPSTWLYVALTSDAPPIDMKHMTEPNGTKNEVLGVVVGSVTRRPTQSLDLRERQALEAAWAAEDGRRLRPPRQHKFLE
jgi:hypothetical protein